MAIHYFIQKVVGLFNEWIQEKCSNSPLILPCVCNLCLEYALVKVKTHQVSTFSIKLTQNPAGFCLTNWILVHGSLGCRPHQHQAIWYIMQTTQRPRYSFSWMKATLNPHTHLYSGPVCWSLKMTDCIQMFNAPSKHTLSSEQHDEEQRDIHIITSMQPPTSCSLVAPFPSLATALGRKPAKNTIKTSKNLNITSYDPQGRYHCSCWVMYGGKKKFIYSSRSSLCKKKIKERTEEKKAIFGP